MHAPIDTNSDDFDLVATWLVADRTRWIAGILAGLFAGAVAMGLAMVMSAASGMEFWFPAKLMASTICGPFATESGSGNFSSVLVGFGLFETLCAFWGFVYAHFVKTSSLGALLAMGLVWGLFAWIFDWNLFMHSFKTILTADISAGAVFPVCIAYGLSLTSVAFFDRLLRGRRP